MNGEQVAPQLHKKTLKLSESTLHTHSTQNTEPVITATDIQTVHHTHHNSLTALFETTITLYFINVPNTQNFIEIKTVLKPVALSGGGSSVAGWLMVIEITF